jgi:dTDP-4-amino-4,6-dideoxygalactose transaminase
MSAWPHYDEDEIEAVQAVLRSGRVNYWTGEEGRSFEREFAEAFKMPHAIALANGSVALELALYALGIGPGDEVVVTPRTYVASASSIVLRGATPIFADVDRESQNITAASVEAVLTPRTRAILAVHLAGWPCEMDGLSALAEAHGLALIEDCAQAHGASYRDRPVGSFGDAAAFSFCQDKIMSTGGEGGMLLLREEAAWERSWAYKDHGKSYQAVYHREHPPGFRWLHEEFGTNWRLTEMQAAIGRIQLRKLPDWVSRRRRNAAALAEGLSGVPGLRLTSPPVHIGHAYYKYYAFIEPETLRSDWDRERILEALEAEGVPGLSGSCSEVYLEKAFRDRGLQPTQRLPIARELGETSLMFLVDPTLGTDDMRRTADAVSRVMQQAVAR